MRARERKRKRERRRKFMSAIEAKMYELRMEQATVGLFVLLRENERLRLN